MQESADNVSQDSTSPSKDALLEEACKKYDEATHLCPTLHDVCSQLLMHLTILLNDWWKWDLRSSISNQHDCCVQHLYHLTNLGWGAFCMENRRMLRVHLLVIMPDPMDIYDHAICCQLGLWIAQVCEGYIYIYIVLFLVKCKGIMLKWGILQFPYFADLIFHVCTYVHGCFCISFYLWSISCEKVICYLTCKAFYNWAIAISDRAKMRGRTKEAEELWKQVWLYDLSCQS